MSPGALEPTLLLTKRFPFSASFTSAGKVIGRNYDLEVTVLCAAATDAAYLERRVGESLISKVHSRDLQLHTDWFMDMQVDEPVIMTVFWGILTAALSPLVLHKLRLENAGRTAFEMLRPGVTA